MGRGALLHSAHFPRVLYSFYELKEGRVHALVRLVHSTFQRVRVSCVKRLNFSEVSNKKPIIRSVSSEIIFPEKNNNNVY